MDVRAWLEQLGLGRYAEAFAENDIDESTLRGLTAEDLRELGVSSLGHRKRILEAIAQLAAPGPRERLDRNERRQVVVLFADICSFTELSADVGAEEARRIVEGFLSRADAIVAEHGGTVDKHVGDATMALFGAPLAHGDDALRAVAAADALQRAMPALSAEIGRPVATHVGIAMGDVVAGDIGSAVRRDYTVLGDTVNLASRLVGEAGPGETVLSDAVWRAVADRMAGRDLGERSLKGIARPQRLWRLEGPRETVSAGRLPFMGRELELAQACAVLSAAAPGAALHIRGDAGIGKSRLLSEILDEAARRGYAPVLARIVDFGADRRQSPLRALAEQLARRAPRWHENEALGPSVRAALHDILEQPLGALAAPYFAMEDARRAALRVQALAELAVVVAASTPLAIAIEDLHWSEDTIRRVVRALARRTQECPIVLLTTSRIESDPVDAAFRRDLGGASLAIVELGPVRKDAMQRLARAAATALDEANAARLVDRSGGNPLFLEQLVLNAEDAEAKPLPGTIRALVQARLDRLSPTDRGALQAASVLGQRFALPALCALLRQPHFSARPLVDAGLLAFDGDMVMFVHALIQEATYASLLSETARGLHRRAAEWLGDAEPDLRASHLDRAGDPAAAWAYRVAAEHFRSSGNLSPALERAERGLELAHDDAETVALRLLIGHLKLELGAAREAEAQFRSVSVQDANATARAEADFGIAAALRIVDDMAGAASAVDRAQAAAETLDLTELRSRCHHLRGNLLFPAGRIEACMEEHRAALAFAERAQSPELVARALGGLADAFYAQGRMRSALETLERCIDAARRAGAGAIEIANRPMAGIAQCFMLRLDAMQEQGETARSLARQAQNRRAELIALHILMMVALEADRPEEGLPHVARACQIVAELGAWRFEGENVAFGAQLEAASGRPKLAAEMAREAVTLCREHAMSYMGPTALGVGAALSDDPAERDAWLIEGESLLQKPSLVHNHLFFRRNAIEASLAAGRTADARHHARALADYSAREPTPYTDLISRRGELLADAADGILSSEGRAELSELLGRLQKAGYFRLARAMHAALH